MFHESSSDGIADHRLACEALGDRIIAGDDDSPRTLERQARAFDFHFERVPISPNFEMVANELASSNLPLIDNDSFFACVTIPPMINSLDERVRKLITSFSTFASAWGAMVPKILKLAFNSALLQQRLMMYLAQTRKILNLNMRVNVVKFAALCKV